MSIPVVFDVLGTCFSFDGAVAALSAAFPALSDVAARSIVSDWFHSSQRNFTYLSMNGDYTPIATVLKTTLPSILLEAGVLPSSESAEVDLTSITSTLPHLQPRPSLKACHEILSTSSEPTFTLLAATNGGAESTRSLFDQALGKEGSSEWGVFSCDEGRVAKPHPAVYEAVWERLGAKKKERVGWFVASHTWDLHAAKKAGFKTAWVSYEEHLPLTELFGTPDIIAKDLEEVAREIIKRESEKSEATFM